MNLEQKYKAAVPHRKMMLNGATSKQRRNTKRKLALLKHSKR